MSRMTIRLVDHDARRRAEITSVLSGDAILVDPYENMAELENYWPSDGIFLVYDQADILEELAHAMAEAGSWLPVAAYAQDPEVDRVIVALRAGALDYVSWPMARDAMLTRLAGVESRSRTIAEKQCAIAEAKARVKHLSSREQQVLADLAHGLSNKEIAQRLGISPRTVEIHRANLIGKIGAKSSAHAIRIAIHGDLG